MSLRVRGFLLVIHGAPYLIIHNVVI